MAQHETYAPEVTARPGTKRHLRQVRARLGFLAVVQGGAEARAREAGSREAAALAEAAEHGRREEEARALLQAHEARVADLQAQIDALTFGALLVLPPAGRG